MLIGKEAPDFLTKAIIDGRIKDISLCDFKGQNKILFFYPLDFTFVCPTELHAFQDSIEEFEKRNTIILGISVDSIYSHQAWLSQPKDKGGIQGISYPLLSDITKNISRSYDVLDEEEGIAYRGLFIIDKNNIIQSMHVNNLSLGRNMKEVIRLLDAIEFVEKHGQVCPANWQKGKKGMDASHSGVVDYFSSE